MAEAYSYYQQLKLQENLLDFGDLIAWTLRLFRERPSVLKKYQQQFRHILVDEFQDTNFSQLQLIKALAPADKDPNLVVVGDDFQSIYKWRGAAISNILDFKKHYPRTKTIILNENYRSTQPLLDVSYAMIKNNEPETLEVKLGIDKSMRTQRKEKIIPQIFVLPNLEAEADFVAGKIMELAAKQSYTYKDFAILARANNHLDVFVAALKRYGIPYQLLGNRGLFDQDEVRTLIFFLKVIVDPTDTPSLFQLLHAEVFQVKPDLLLEMLRLSKNERKTLWQIVQESSRAHEGLQLLVKEVAQARQRAIKESAAPILFDFVQQTGYVTQFLKDETLENQLKLKNLNLFFNLLKRFESEHQEDTLVDGVEYLDLLIEAGENPAQAEIEDIDTVNLLTVHSAKGLEFPVVFVANLVADRFPTRNRGDQIKIPDNLIKESLPSGDYHLQEERRLFYVACTRAKDYGGAREKRLSGFVKELGVKIEEEKAAEDKQLSWLEVPPEAIIKPRRIIDGKLRLDFISYSQIETFNTCPLKYKYRYILQVPAKPHHALTFGQSIHYTLRDFHRFEQKGQTPNLETLLYLYEKHFLPLGYDSLEHREARFEAGKKALTSYFKVYKDQFKGKPYLLEQKFRVNLAGVWLIGKIDRIDKLNQYKFELIDYKTGELKEQNKVDKDAQLTIYKMAAQTALRIDVGNLALYFIEANKKLLTRRTNEQLEEKKEEIIKTIEKMRQSKFEATPAYPFPCSWCEYNRICPFAKKA